MRRLLFAAVLVLVPGFSLGARADINDLQIYKLGNPSAAGTAGSNAAASFRMLSNELGVSMSAITLAPPTTIGEDGFAFAFEYTVAFVNGGATVGNGAQPYWVTAGGNPSVMQFPTLHFRKGLPYSLEVGGKVSAITNSSMFTGTVEAKWGLVEGFRYLPDLGVRFAMTRLFGEQDMNLTSGDLDFSLGKEFGVGGLLTLTPYAGYALLGVDSSLERALGDPGHHHVRAVCAEPHRGPGALHREHRGQQLVQPLLRGPAAAVEHRQRPRGVQLRERAVRRQPAGQRRPLRPLGVTGPDLLALTC